MADKQSVSLYKSIEFKVVCDVNTTKAGHLYGG